MDEYLASTLKTAVIDRLDYLDRLVTDADELSRAALAETEMARLTQAWRDLLDQHAPDAHGRCPQCSGWRHPRRHPCTVWTTAHQHLIAADGPPATGTEGTRLQPDGRPSRELGPHERGQLAVAPNATRPASTGIASGTHPSKTLSERVIR